MAISGQDDLRTSAEPRPDRHAGFRELVGYRLVEWREGFAEVTLDITGEHLNRMGIVHGGVYMTILDAAMGNASTWCSAKGNTRKSVTISLTTTFLSPARQGVIRARGFLVGCEARIATCRGEIMDEAGTLLITGQGSFRYLPGSERLEGVSRGTSGE